MNISGPSDIQAIADVVLVVLTLGNAWGTALNWRMRANFVSKEDLESIEDKLEKKTDGLDKRIREVERDLSGVAAEIRGVRDGVSRIEHMTGLLIEHRLRETEGG